MIAWVVAVAFAYLTNKPFVFKSNDWSRTTVIPELTSVDNRVEEMCRLTASHLVKKLRGEMVPQQTTVDAELIRRESF